MSEVVIEFKNVTKKYKLFKSEKRRLLYTFCRKIKYQEKKAVDNVSFQVRRGESVALFGKNGAGKSTILKMITGVCFPTEGEITVKGRVSALLELTSGFDTEFTGRENIYLKGQLLGLKDKEIKELEQEREKATQNDTELKDAQQKITEGNKITGMTEVTGPGVIITLSDGKGVATSTLNPSQLIVHDLDVLSVVNELINAGAEAISINDQRWVLTTAISCRGNTIDINGERIGAPFTIKAIGLPEYLAGLERVGGYLEYMKQDGVGVKLEKSNSITIPKYSGVINFEYLQNVEE